MEIFRELAETRQYLHMQLDHLLFLLRGPWGMGHHSQCISERKGRCIVIARIRVRIQVSMFEILVTGIAGQPFRQPTQVLQFK